MRPVCSLAAGRTGRILQLPGDVQQLLPLAQPCDGVAQQPRHTHLRGVQLLGDLAGHERDAEQLGVRTGDRGRGASAPVVPGLPHGEVSLTVAGIELSYDARVFFQAHRGLLGALVERVVGEETGETAYDLYSGVGLFSLPLARRYERVVAVEADRIAARYCRNNARRNKLPGVETVNRSVESWVEELPKDAPRVVVDPPRSGLPAVVRRTLTARPPRRLTYVSCHAATLARDLKALTRRFTLDELTLFDLFPQTGHMEAVVQMTRVEQEDAG